MTDDAIYTAVSGALVQEMRLEVISNNLANIDTVGFKADRAVFKSVLSSADNTLDQADLDGPGDSDVLPEIPDSISNCQVEFEGTQTDFDPGNIRQTGNTFDLALEGDGFFCILTPQGNQQYTRKGNFKLSEDGKLITQEGSEVLGQNGKEINITGQNMAIDEKGNILVDGATVDKIKVVDFPKPYPLVKVGDSSFIPSDPAASGTDAENVIIKQGFIEQSNVNPIKAMTEMIEVQRAYESYQKIIRSMDDILSKSITEIGSAP